MANKQFTSPHRYPASNCRTRQSLRTYDFERKSASIVCNTVCKTLHARRRMQHPIFDVFIFFFILFVAIFISDFILTYFISRIKEALIKRKSHQDKNKQDT